MNKKNRGIILSYAILGQVFSGSVSAATSSLTNSFSETDICKSPTKVKGFKVNLYSNLNKITGTQKVYFKKRKDIMYEGENDTNPKAYST